MKPVARTSRAAQWFRRNVAAALAGALLVAGLFAPPSAGLQAGGRSADEPEDPLKPKVEPGAVEVRFADNSVLKLTLREEKLEIVTPYGKLLVPVADILKIEFATRLSEADEKRIPVLIKNLGSEDPQVRDAATTELVKLGEKAYPALLQAQKSKDPEVARRANDLVEKVRDTVPKENLEVRPDDVIYTENSKFTGRLSVSSMKALSPHFGEVQVKLVDVRNLRSLAYVEPDKEVVNAVPAPASLQPLQNQVGKVFHFTVTGAVNGGVWGTDIYTLDSHLPSAAVHAGVLKPGQTGVVKVKIVLSPPAFTGSQRNGVISGDFSAFPGAFQILKK
jgi:hypothetical protein